MKEKLARWFIEKYLPDMHLHANPKAKNERPKVQGVMNMTREEYMDWRLKAKYAPESRDYEDPAEFEHEREKWVMKMEAKADEGR
jgi:hypothetical protein